jgi:hypothetical protein
MSHLKTYVLALETKGYYRAFIDATSEADAISRAFKIWTTEEDHPFEQFDEELLSVVAEVQS